MNLLSAAERFAAIDRSEVLLLSERCLYSRDQFSTCEACFDVCPVGAIQPGKPPALIADKCQSCLACLPVCQTGAYSADDAVQPLLACVTRLETKTVELVCALHGAAGVGSSTETVGIRVQGCLAGLGIGTYLALAAMGLERIILRLDACVDCPWAALQRTVQTQVDQANRLLTHWGKGKSLVFVLELDEQSERPLWDAKNPPLSRRDLFRLAAHQGQVAMARAMSQQHAETAHCLGRDRLRLNNAVAHLPEPTLFLDAPIAGDNFTTLSVSDACNACATCARACPTDALNFHVNDEKTYYHLYFNAQACIGCEACVHVCIPDAVELNKVPTFSQVFGQSEPYTVNEGELRQCSQCKTLIAARTDQDLCPVCAYRRRNPFGSLIPPGIKTASKKPGV